MSHEREAKLSNEYKKQNSNHWQVGASKQRAYIHKRAGKILSHFLTNFLEREIDIERENLKLL
jgi:hypothetical protein